MQDAEAVGRSNNKRKVVGLCYLGKAGALTFFNFVLWLSSAGHKFGFLESFHPWSTPGCGCVLREGRAAGSLLCCLLSLIPKRLFAAALGVHGTGVHFQKPFGKGAERFVPMR